MTASVSPWTNRGTDECLHPLRTGYQLSHLPQQTTDRTERGESDYETPPVALQSSPAPTSGNLKCWLVKALKGKRSFAATHKQYSSTLLGEHARCLSSSVAVCIST